MFINRYFINYVFTLSFMSVNVWGYESKINFNTKNKRYNQISFAATHNGQSNAHSPVQNQTLSLTKQFENGIRATKIHVWYDKNEQGDSVPYVCHGVAKEVIDGSYFEKIIAKIPRIFQSWARNALKEFEPVNTLFQDACKCAYGHGDATGVIQMRHCILDPSRKLLRDTLKEIKEFLEKNSQEILTLILEDHTQNLDHIAKDFEAIGLDNLAHQQPLDQEWPLINDMLKSNKRLVVLLHGNEKLAYHKYPWLHQMWKYAWDTEYDFPDTASLKDPTKDIMPKRGIESFNNRYTGAKNKLFIVHHFITPAAGGSKDGARKVNRRGFLKHRLDRLAKTAGQQPNIVQIDFFEAGDKDVLQAINSFNA